MVPLPYPSKLGVSETIGITVYYKYLVRNYFSVIDMRY